MKAKLDNNQIKAAELAIPAAGIIPEIAVVRNVRLSYQQDADGKRTEKVEAVRYDCIDPDSYASFTIKVETNRPVISKEELDAAEDAICIAIPVDKVTIRPYAIEYGMAKVSIVAPMVTLANN